MIKITIVPHVTYTEEKDVKDYAIIRDNGKVLFVSINENDCLVKAWNLVRDFGLVLVEPWC